MLTFAKFQTATHIGYYKCIKAPVVFGHEMGMPAEIKGVLRYSVLIQSEAFPTADFC